jgi:hypothetical protein
MADAVVPARVAQTMVDRAERWDVEAGGRFTVRNNRTIVLWSAEAHPDGGRVAPVASVHIRWHTPTFGQALVWRLCWDAELSNCDEVCAAVELVVGASPPR